MQVARLRVRAVGIGRVGEQRVGGHDVARVEVLELTAVDLEQRVHDGGRLASQHWLCRLAPQVLELRVVVGRADEIGEVAHLDVLGERPCCAG